MPSSATHVNRLQYAFVCSSNQNRSMAAHNIFLRTNSEKNGDDVIFQPDQLQSYGTGSQVKLPGKSATTPNVYDFGTKYSFMIDDLKKQDKRYYIHNGVLPMLERNAKIKPSPQKFQKEFVFADVVITFEDRVFNTVVEELQYRAISSQTVINHRACHVINMNIVDNHREAERGARMCLELAREIESSEDWENDIRSILYTFERKYKRFHVFHVVLFI